MFNHLDVSDWLRTAPTYLVNTNEDITWLDDVSSRTCRLHWWWSMGGCGLCCRLGVATARKPLCAACWAHVVSTDQLRGACADALRETREPVMVIGRAAFYWKSEAEAIKSHHTN